MKKLFILQIAIALFCIIGQVKCVIKMINCDWDPIGKSEIIYTAATFTGLGSIIGYINIED
tara:strand:+ start:284 stop:466 length:183 start_codon:yes stop_codon:yes gene_type:complete